MANLTGNILYSTSNESKSGEVGLVQQQTLPPSSYIGAPTKWNLISTNLKANSTSSGYYKILCKGDYLYLFENDSVRIGNLVTKVWENSPIKFNCNAVLKKGIPGNVTFYDDYKIFYYPYTSLSNKSDSRYDAKSFNTTNRVVSDIDKFSVSTYNDAFSNNIYLSRCIYLPKHRQIWVFPYLINYMPNLPRIPIYDINTNSYSYIDTPTSSIPASGNNVCNVILATDTDEQYIYMTGANTNPPIFKIGIDSHTITKLSSVSKISFRPTEWCPFNGRQIVFNGTKCMEYDVVTNTLYNTSVPNAPVAPGWGSTAVYKDSLLMITNEGLYQLPFVYEKPTGQPMVLKLLKGQKVCGERPLTIKNKLNIGITPTVLDNDVEIYLGEYDSFDTYNLLVETTF